MKRNGNMENLFNYFVKASNSRLKNESNCQNCPFGESFDYSEKLKFPELYREWSNYSDGCLIQIAFKPKSNSIQCQMCFESWVEEKKVEGKICGRCNVWLSDKQKAALSIRIDSKYDGGYTLRTYRSVCEGCLLRGKTVDEWARDMVEKNKRIKK